MSSKRKLGSLGLERRVKARREEDWEPELSASEEDDSGEEVSEEGDDSGDEDEDVDEAESGSEVCCFDSRNIFLQAYDTYVLNHL